MTDDIIILAGGASSRMKQSGGLNLSEKMIQQANSKSKALIEFNGRPMLDFLLYNIAEAGFKNVYLVIGEIGEAFRSHYGKEEVNSYMGLKLSYAIQYIPKNRTKPLGTADAVFQALEQHPKLQERSFVVCNSDNLYSVEALNTLRQTTSKNTFINYDRDALKYSHERISRFALTKTDDNNYLLDIIEKPSEAETDKYNDASGKLRVSMNIFKFDGPMFYPFLKACPVHPERQEKELPTALLNMVREYQGSTLGISFSEHVPDLTGKDDIAIMNEYLANHPLNLNKK